MLHMNNRLTIFHENSDFKTSEVRKVNKSFGEVNVAVYNHHKKNMNYSDISAGPATIQSHCQATVAEDGYPKEPLLRTVTPSNHY